MSSFIARQPNGKLCRFSTVVDTVTHWNLTDEDFIELCAEMAREDARNILKHSINPFESVKKRFFPLNVSIEEFERILHEMGDEEGLGQERIDYLKEAFPTIISNDHLIWPLSDSDRSRITTPKKK